VVIIVVNSGGKPSDTLEGIENVTGTLNGNDTFIGDTNVNTFNGLGGDDTVKYDYISDANIDVSVDMVLDTASDGSVTDKLLNIENVTGGDGDDTFIMDKADVSNIIDGDAGNNTISYEKYTGTSEGVTVNLSTTSAQTVRAIDAKDA